MGTIDARGLYTAPATLPNPNFVKVSASSITGPSASATAPVTLYNPIPILASVSPKSLSVGRFTLVITGSKFVKGAQVQFAGRALQTTFNSSSRVTASGTADSTQVGNAQVLLTNPVPGAANSSAPVSVEVIAPADPTPPDASQSPSQDPAGIFDGQGNFDANAYVQAAKAYGTPAMINERFGSPWTAYHQSISPPTWSQASSFKYVKPTNPGRVVLLFPRRSVHYARRLQLKLCSGRLCNRFGGGGEQARSGRHPDTQQRPLRLGRPAATFTGPWAADIRR